VIPRGYLIASAAQTASCRPSPRAPPEYREAYQFIVRIAHLVNLIYHESMLKTYKNGLLGVIREAGLSPSLFQLLERVEDGSWGGKIIVTALEVIGTPLAFHIGELDDFHTFKHRESIFKLNFPLSHWIGSGTDSVAYSYDTLAKNFRGWLERVVSPYLRERDEPDLWALHSADTTLLQADSVTEDNTPFNAVELHRISTSLGEVKAFLIQTHQSSADERRFIEERLKYLEEAAHRLGRKDWINIAAGVTSNIVVGLTLAPDAAREFFHFVGQALSWLLDVVRLLP
jgi:hypothetical protein